MSRKTTRTPRATVPTPRWKVAAVCGLLVLAVLAVFGQTRGFEFLNYDDDDYVYDNPFVRSGLSFAAVADTLDYVHSFTWHPLTTVSHMADCELYGLDAGAHHLTNVALHAAAAMALFLVLLRMTGAFYRSAFVALAFAVHPLRVESVAWISERKDVLSGLFFMLTLWAYARYAEASAGPLGRTAVRPYYLAALGFFVLALLSKPMVVTLPFVLLLLDGWPLARLGDREAPLRNLRARWVEKVPFFALSIACGIVTLRTQTGAMTLIETLPLGGRVANALVSYAVYLRQLFVPTDLAVVYPHARGGLPLWTVGGAALLLAGLTAAAVLLRRRMPFLAVGWLWYLGMLVPVIGLVQVGVQAHADRYTYLPHVGLLVMVAWGAAELWPKHLDRRGLAALAAVAAIVLIWLARDQTRHWRDSESLWRMTLERTEANSVAHAQLGIALEQSGETAEAVEHYRRAIAIQPDYATPRYNLGNVLAARGDVDGAVEQYRQAIRVRPDYARAHHNLGSALLRQGRRDEAVAQYREALRIDPSYAAAHDNLGVALAGQGEIAAAVEHFRRSLEIEPGSARTHALLAMGLEQSGDRAGAIEHYRRAMELAAASGDRRLAEQLRARLTPGTDR
jgi:Flp pilus assembly protein TadD